MTDFQKWLIEHFSKEPEVLTAYIQHLEHKNAQLSKAASQGKALEDALDQLAPLAAYVNRPY